MSAAQRSDACAPVDGSNALILSGGGANGAYEVGVVLALCTGASRLTGFRPFHPDIITGTSIGAFNASVLASRMRGDPHAAAEYLQHIWLDDIPRDDSTRHNHVFRYRADPLEFFNPQLGLTNPTKPLTSFARDTVTIAQDFARRAVRFFDSSEGLETRLLELVDVSTFIDIEPTRRLVEKHVQTAEVVSSPIALKLATTNWDTGELRVFTNREATNKDEVPMTEHLVPLSVLASASIPGLFPPVMIDGVYYVDGGTVMNTPMTPAIRAGADILHVIYLDPNVKNIPVESLQSTIDIMSRMLIILFAVSMNRDIRAAMRINREIAAFGELKNSVLSNTPAARNLLERVARVLLRGRSRSLRPLTIHRYHPKDDISGMLGMLNFNRDRIAGLIERGFRDAVDHDCAESECVLYERTGSGETLDYDAAFNAQ